MTTVEYMGCRASCAHCVFMQCMYNLPGHTKKFPVADRTFIYSSTTEHHYHCVEASCWARIPGSSAWEQEAPLNKYQSSQLCPTPPLAGSKGTPPPSEDSWCSTGGRRLLFVNTADQQGMPRLPTHLESCSRGNRSPLPVTVRSC